MSEYTRSMELALDEWKRTARSQGEKIIALTSDNQSLRDEVARLRDELDVYRAAVQYTFEAINKFDATRTKQAALTPQGEGEDEVR